MLTTTFAELLQLDPKWLRHLRGLDRADAMRTLKRMEGVRGPLQQILATQWELPMWFMRYFEGHDQDGGRDVRIGADDRI